MDNQKLAEKIITCFEKEKYRKFDRLLLKNKNNTELFEILLNNPIFINDYLTMQPDDAVFRKLSVPVQKQIIQRKPNLVRMASDEIRNDRIYMEQLQYMLDTNELKDERISSVYGFLGPELANDKEYLISIQDKSPVDFLQAIKKLQFDDAIIKQFFDKYPHYVADLPDNLKYNYDYVVSLIEKLPPNNLAMYCYEMDYDYLKNDKIKEGIIKLSGEKEYSKVLALSLSNDQSQLKKVNPDEFKKLILVCPDAFIPVDRFEGVLSVGQQRSNISLIQQINKVARLHYKNIDSPRKLTAELYELSNAIGDGLTYEIIQQQVMEHWDEIDPWISQVDEWHELDDATLSNSADIGSFYNVYNLLIGIQSNKLHDMFKIFINSELRSSQYAEGIKNINVTEDNISFLQLVCNSNLFNCDAKSIEMFNDFFLRISKWNNDPYTAVQFINNLSKDYNLYNLVANNNGNIDQDLLLNVFGYVSSGMNSISRISQLEELRDFEKFMEDNLDKNQFKTIKDNKHFSLLKNFQIDLSAAENIIHSYLGAKDDSSLYQNMPEAKYLKTVLETIINAGDIKELENINQSLDNQEAQVSFKDVYQVLNNIKQVYGDTINSSLLQVDQTSSIIDASNVDFNLLVHVIGAYGSVPPGDIYESWNTKEKTSMVSICTSFISDNNMGIARTNEHSVIMGFNNLPRDFLELMSCNDLYSKGFSASRPSRFLTVEELKNNTRHGHNEVVIRRRKGEFTEEKIEPSYIVCFDSINVESRTASEKFGIPIIFVDREKVASRHHNEIIDMVDKFKETLDPRLISKIICEQENNKAGLRLERPDLVEKYFNTEFRQNNIEMLYSVIETGLKNNNPNAFSTMNEFVRSIETEADKFKVSKETPHRKNIYDIKYDEMVQSFKSNPGFKEDFELPAELLPEQLYEKFVQCRDRLALSESAELEYINSNQHEYEQAVSQRK